MTARGLGLAVLERSMLVFLADVTFHARVALVDIGGDWRLDVFGVEDLVHDVVAVGFHVVNLIRRPTVHSQGLDLGDMGAQLAVQRSTSHAQEYSHIPACPSWIQCATISATVITRDRPDEVL